MGKTPKELYLKKLKECGFRSWKKANERRIDLIELELTHEGIVKPEEIKEFEDLQELASLYFNYKGTLSKYSEMMEFILKLEQENEL